MTTAALGEISGTGWSMLKKLSWSVGWRMGAVLCRDGNHEVPLPLSPPPPSLSQCQTLAQLAWPRNGQREKILEMWDKKGLFASKKAKKKRVHRISCSPFCRQSYPTPILLGDWWQGWQERQAFHFLPGLSHPPPSPLLPPSKVSNPLSSDKNDSALTKLSWILCRGSAVAVWQGGLTRPISRSRHRRRNGPWCCPHIARDRPWQSAGLKETRNIKESSWLKYKGAIKSPGY